MTIPAGITETSIITLIVAFILGLLVGLLVKKI